MCLVRIQENSQQVVTNTDPEMSDNGSVVDESELPPSTIEVDTISLVDSVLQRVKI